MPPFNLSRWIAKEVTCLDCRDCFHKKTCSHPGLPLNKDKKIFIVGGAGSGKSMTGVRLTKPLNNWISYYNNNGIFKPDEAYYSFDKDHVAIISTKDLLHVMATKLKRNSIKIIDDCGASEGFTNRRSMSQANLDMASVYGTNRTQNGVTIYCVQDTSFTDKRMRMLADVIIDLTNYYQSGRFRIGLLRKIKKDETRREGIIKSRFMTYEHGEWVTQETIACELPDRESKKMYDEMREAKEVENSKAIHEKYNKQMDSVEVQDNKPRCPYCGSSQLYYSEKKKVTKCKGCGKLV